jgi:hypothetical protein
VTVDVLRRLNCSEGIVAWAERRREEEIIAADRLANSLFPAARDGNRVGHRRRKALENQLMSESASRAESFP